MRSSNLENNGKERIIMRERAAQNLHTASYLEICDNYTYFRSSLHFTSSHFSTLHYPSFFTSQFFSLPCRFGRLVNTFQKLFTSHVHNYFPNHIANNMCFTVRWCLCRQTCRLNYMHQVEEIQQDATVCRYLFTVKLLHMFRASIAPIIRST